MKQFRVIENYHLIIPALCIGFWAIAYLLQYKLIFNDFNAFYYSGKQIFINPEKLYDIQGYVYLPSFALVFSVTISLFPFLIAYSIFFILNYIFGVLMIREFNKILILMEIKKNWHRFIFLIIISNGGLIMIVFYYNQTKFIVSLILLFILRREIHTLIEENEKDIKYILVNYNLFIFAIGMAPNYIYLLLIYLFYDINFKEIFKWKNIKIYAIVITIFLIQNFLFIIYPLMFLDFIKGRATSTLFYIDEFFKINPEIIFLFSVVAMAIITFFIICNKKLNIIEQFGYYAFFSIFFSFHARRTLMILLPLTLLLYVPFLKKNENVIDFIKSNKILLLGLLSIFCLFQWIYRESIFLYFPFMESFPFIILVDLRWIILISILAGSLIVLEFNQFKERIINQNETNNENLT